MKPKIAFIVGYPRSGTSWVMWLLANHPDVVACFHAGLFQALNPLREWWSQEVPYGKRIYTLRPGTSSTDTGRSRHTDKVLTDLLDRDQLRRQVAPLVEHVIETIASCKNNPALVTEKTPENLLLMPWILELLPEAYVLNIVRDPRSAYLSAVKAVSTWADRGALSHRTVESARRWVKYMEIGQEIAVQNERYKAIRYEDLLTDGPRELADIHAWLGLESSPQLCAAAFENSQIASMRKARVAPEGFFRKGTPAEWRKGLSTSDIRAIEYITADWLKRLNYPIVHADQRRAPIKVRIDGIRTRLVGLIRASVAKLPL